MKFTELKKQIVDGNWNDIQGLIKTNYVPIGIKQGIAKQSVTINEETKEYYNNLINIQDGYATLNRMENEINLYFLLCELYTNIKFEDDFTDKEYDFFAKNKFKEWLYKKTDAYTFEQMFRGIVLDEIRRINSPTNADIEGLKEALDRLEHLDPNVLEALKGLNPTSLNAMREMVANEQNSNDSKQ